MIGQTAAQFKISFTQEKSSEQQQHGMFTSKKHFVVNTVISRAPRLIVLGFELCYFHLSMSGGSPVTKACRVFRFRTQRR
jgi:hypothetical protein